MAQTIQSAKVICRGGLDSSENYLELSELAPGSASELTNFESSLYGGYRKVNGYVPYLEGYETVDNINAEGPILCTAIFNEAVIVARKQKSGNTYKFYNDMGTGWTPFSTGLTLNSLGVTKIRWRTFNFNGTNKIMFVDGVNPPTVFTGTIWTAPTGDQSITGPAYIATFRNTVFVSGSSANPNIVTYTAPNDESMFNATPGAGQIPCGFRVVQLKAFRDSLYVFGVNQIKRVVLSGTDFVLEDVTENIGCIASDSVIEINGDLLFLSQDGIRPISATEKIGDVELASVSKRIQERFVGLINDYSMPAVDAVVIRSKSQFRYFFNDSVRTIDSNDGILGSLRSSNEGESWEWASLKGFRTSNATSGYINLKEYIIHGDYNGGVYRQEVGNNLNGRPIVAVFQTTFLDFGETQVRKTLRKVNLFIKPEGPALVQMALKYDWNLSDVISPEGYSQSLGTGGVLYGEGIYGVSVYGGMTVPLVATDVQGSGFSVRATFSTSSTTDASYSIQGIVFEFSADGRD